MSCTKQHSLSTIDIMAKRALAIRGIQKAFSKVKKGWQSSFASEYVGGSIHSVSWNSSNEEVVMRNEEGNLLYNSLFLMCFDKYLYMLLCLQWLHQETKHDRGDLLGII